MLWTNENKTLGSLMYQNLNEWGGGQEEEKIEPKKVGKSCQIDMILDG